MREYGKVYCALWSSSDFRHLDEDGRALVLYLLTCPHTTIAGVFRLPYGYITDDMQWTRERVDEGFLDLVDRGFATHCPVTQWVWINKFLVWNPPENPNQWKAVNKIISQIPKDCLWLSEFYEHFPSESHEETGENRNPSETLPQPVTVSVAVTGSKNAPAVRTWFAEFRLAYPPRSGGQRWRDAEKAANARVSEGHTPAEFLEGAKRYAAHCQALGKLKTEYVLQAATFLGTNKLFLESWDLPETPKSLAAADRDAADLRAMADLKLRADRIGFRQPMDGEDVLGYKTLVRRAEHDYEMARPVSRETKLTGVK